jgi:hypothetical protein
LQIIENWEAENKALIEPLQSMMADMEMGGWSFAKLTIVNALIREWAAKLSCLIPPHLWGGRPPRFIAVVVGA